jgi:glucosylceramidase
MMLAVTLVLVLAALGGPPFLTTAQDASSVGSFLTTTDRKHLFEGQPNIPLLPAAPEGASIRIDSATQYQRIVGYGAAITDASAFVLHSAQPQLYNTLMNLLFAPFGELGVGLSVVRVPMGVSDFSISYAHGNITYADKPDDWPLAHFTTAHDDAYILPVLRKARQINRELKIVASPWTAPLWLKVSLSLNPSQRLRGVTMQIHAFCSPVVPWALYMAADYGRAGQRVAAGERACIRYLRHVFCTFRRGVSSKRGGGGLHYTPGR